MRSAIIAALLWFLPATALPQGVDAVNFFDLNLRQSTHITFEHIRPGNVDDILDFGSVSMAERFDGLEVVSAFDRYGTPHDVVNDLTPSSPLGLRTGAVKRNLSILYSSPLDAQVLFPIGLHGYDKRSGKGEGSVAMLFAEDQCEFGIVIFLDGRKEMSVLDLRWIGQFNVTFFDRSGTVLGTHKAGGKEGIYRLGYRRAPGHAPDIAGVFIQNMDREGIDIGRVVFNDHCVGPVS